MSRWSSHHTTLYRQFTSKKKKRNHYLSDWSLLILILSHYVALSILNFYLTRSYSFFFFFTNITLYILYCIIILLLGRLVIYIWRLFFINKVLLICALILWLQFIGLFEKKRTLVFFNGFEWRLQFMAISAVFFFWRRRRRRRLTPWFFVVNSQNWLAVNVIGVNKVDPVVLFYHNLIMLMMAVLHILSNMVIMSNKIPLLWIVTVNPKCF